MTTSVNEAYFWKQIKQGLESPDTHLSRIENVAGTGISDVSACRNGVEVWLELKVFHSQRLHFRNSQRNWIVRRTDVGGRVIVVARKDDELLVYDARSTVLSSHAAYPDKKSFSVHRDDLPQPLYSCRKPFKWDEVREAIFDAHRENMPVPHQQSKC